MNRWLLLAAALVAAFWLGLAWCARAEAGPYDTPTGEWFKSLRGTFMGTGFSCCSESDCRPTRAFYENGAWWAVPYRGKPGELVQIPEQTILKDKVSPFVKDGEGLAVLCEAQFAHAYSVTVEGTMGTMVFIFCFAQPPNFS